MAAARAVRGGALLALVAGGAAAASRAGPRANWTTVPTMYMSGMHGARNESEIALLARFDVVCVNKMEGQHGGCNTSACAEELRQVDTLRRVKAANPAVFTMSYMNTMMNFEWQAMAAKYTDDLLVTNASSGKVAQFHGDAMGPKTYAAFNLSLAAARQPWLDEVDMFLDTGVVDGLFADKGNNWAGHGHCKGPASLECWELVDRNDTICQNACVVVGEAPARAYNQGKAALLAAAEARLRARGGLLALRNDTEPLYSSRAQYKRFTDTGRITREEIEGFMALEGKLDTLIAWALPSNSPKGKDPTHWRDTLAAFLVAAWDGMFLEATPCCATSAQHAWAPEYGYALGAPLGKAALDEGGVYRRGFASGTTVAFDTTTGVGNISWASTESVY